MNEAIYYFTPKNGSSPGIGTGNMAFSTRWMNPMLSLLGTALPVRQLMSVLQPPVMFVNQVAPVLAAYGAPLGGVPTGQMFTPMLYIGDLGRV